MTPLGIDDWRARLRAALTPALRARQAALVSVLRETLAALDDAEAVELGQAPNSGAGGAGAPFAGSAAGLGAGEVARRTVSPEEATAVVAREQAERRRAAADLRALGRTTDAERLEQQAAAIDAVHGAAQS